MPDSVRIVADQDNCIMQVENQPLGNNPLESRQNSLSVRQLQRNNNHPEVVCILEADFGKFSSSKKFMQIPSGRGHPQTG